MLGSCLRYINWDRSLRNVSIEKWLSDDFIPKKCERLVFLFVEIYSKKFGKKLKLLCEQLKKN